MINVLCLSSARHVLIMLSSTRLGEPTSSVFLFLRLSFLVCILGDGNPPNFYMVYQKSVSQPLLPWRRELTDSLTSVLQDLFFLSVPRHGIHRQRKGDSGVAMNHSRQNHSCYLCPEDLLGICKYMV